MYAKVSDTYYGTYGLFVPETKSVSIKTREDAPFEIDDELFFILAERGVLVEAAAKPEKAKKKPEPIAEPEAPDEGEEGEIDLKNLSYNELREMAKGLGVPHKVGMSKESLKDAIKEAYEDDAPILTTEEPD